jgi:transcriptional regulator with XRE-family HTH domain
MGVDRMIGAEPLALRFGENLLIHRRRAGLSQEELSFRADLHRTEIGMLERGIRLPRLDTIIKVAGGIEITPGELLEGMEWRPGPYKQGSFRLDSPVALAVARRHRRTES